MLIKYIYFYYRKKNFILSYTFTLNLVIRWKRTIILYMIYTTNFLFYFHNYIFLKSWKGTRYQETFEALFLFNGSTINSKSYFCEDVCLLNLNLSQFPWFEINVGLYCNFKILICCVCFVIIEPLLLLFDLLDIQMFTQFNKKMSAIQC